MGWVDKIKRMTGNDGIDDYDETDSYYGSMGTDDYDVTGDYGVQQNESAQDSGNGYTPMSSAMGMGSASSISGLGSSAIELKVVKPEKFDCVPQIADHLLNKRTVVLNLEATNKETARRLIDFLSGVAYSIDGQLKRIANNAYVITPSNVDVSGEQLREKKEKKEEEPATNDFYSDL